MNTPPPLPPGPSTNTKQFIWWILWLSFLSCFPMYYIFLRKPDSHGTQGLSSPSFAIPMMAAPLLISVILRWVAIPRMPSAQSALPIFVMGIAFAEAVCFFGIFLFPKYTTPAFIVSAVGIFQFMPIFAGRFNEPPRR